MTYAEFADAWASINRGVNLPRPEEVHEAWQEYLRQVIPPDAVKPYSLKDVPEDRREEFIAAAVLLWG